MLDSMKSYGDTRGVTAMPSTRSYTVSGLLLLSAATFAFRTDSINQIVGIALVEDDSVVQQVGAAFAGLG